ncbi:hypothetical protein BS50DRAFT_205903 [Corynespora cassiicola Philippines]|uniref:Uncharacterized protein n=1 Tax=Corynespora cassiicola Philippines TaxID=1448308 RepID=A0A2T2N5D0_CORCC|nr:hypothetical protein BS50DRAFT_205903 [Corynespora cassiicola Philippines]
MLCNANDLEHLKMSLVSEHLAKGVALSITYQSSTSSGEDHGHGGASSDGVGSALKGSASGGLRGGSGARGDGGASSGRVVGGGAVGRDVGSGGGGEGSDGDDGELHFCGRGLVVFLLEERWLVARCSSVQKMTVDSTVVFDSGCLAGSGRLKVACGMPFLNGGGKVALYLCPRAVALPFPQCNPYPPAYANINEPSPVPAGLWRYAMPRPGIGQPLSPPKPRRP